VAVDTLLAGLLIAVGLVGVVVPALPGLLLVVAGIAVWAVPRGDAVGWTVLGVAVAVVAVGTVAKYALPGSRLRAAGVPGRTLLAGGVLGIVGFFVVPVVGLPLGFVLAVYLAELGRLHDRRRAWRATVVALQATGLTILIELAGALVAAGAWLLAALLT